MRKMALRKFRLLVALGATLLGAPLAAGADDVDLGDNSIVASAGGVTVTLGDLKAFVEQVRLDRNIDVQPDQDTLLGIAEQILIFRSLAREAEREGLDRDAMVVRQLELRREELLGKTRLKEVIAKAPFPDLDQVAKETYLTDKDRYTRPDEVRAAHILIGIQDRSEEEAMALAERLRVELESHPERFAELATEHSDDPGSAEKGGELGWFSRKRMVTPFADAAFALQSPGELSPVVRSKFGYHIIRLDERRAGELIPFEEVKAEIVVQEQAAHRKRVRRDYIEKVATAPDLQYDHGVMEAYARSISSVPASAP